MANKRFSAIKNDFCLIFERNAQIKDCEDDLSIPGFDGGAPRVN